MKSVSDRVLGLDAWLAWLILGAWLSGVEAAAPASRAERLRQLVRLPRVNTQFHSGVSSEGLISVNSFEPATQLEIEELTRAMRGTPADAPRWLRLAWLYSEAPADYSKSEPAAKRAVELYRQQGAEQSSDARVLAEYGTALHKAYDSKTAEPMLRRAVALASDQWRCQMALGRFLSTEAFVCLWPREALRQLMLAMPGTPPPSGYRPTPEQITQARQRITEAMGCLDTAVRLAPKEAEALLARAGAKATRGGMEVVFQRAAGTEIDPHKAALAVFPAEAVPDLQAAAQLAPNDYRRWTFLAIFTLASAGRQQEAVLEGLADRGAWPELPAETRDLVKSAMNRLETIAQGDDPKRAAGALEGLGMLQTLVMGDTRQGEVSLRRAVALDPARDQAWENLVLLLAKDDKFADLLPVAEQRLRHRESPRNRLMVAKALERTNQPDRMRREIEALHSRYPEDFDANVAMAAILLKNSTDDLSASRAARFLIRAERLLGSRPTGEQVYSLLLTRGLALALTGLTDEARQHLKKVLELAKDDPAAKDALGLLDAAD